LSRTRKLNRQKIRRQPQIAHRCHHDICAAADIVWAVWPNGQVVVKGHELVATGATRTSWIAIACADKAEAADLERKLA
jgi:hypothetical protein